MDSVCRAVIDIGTNSVKVLVAEVAGREVRPVWEQSHQTRLGQGFYDTQRLQPGPIAETAAADFARRAGALRAASIRIIATSAAREAVNAPELLAAVEQASGLPVQVISGDQEADWTFQGATTDPALAASRLLLLDVGGGSTECVLGQGTGIFFRASFPLGTVRLLEKLPPSDPPEPEQLAACRVWLDEFFGNEIEPKLRPALAEAETRFPWRSGAGEAGAHLPGDEPMLIATGGTASILGGMEARLEKFDRQRIETTRLSRERLTWHVERLWSLALVDRRKTVGLPPNRADVILMGVAIYEAWLRRLGCSQLRLTTRGLRFAALLA